jgi:membrane protein DedA with SNARE-associated domain
MNYATFTFYNIISGILWVSSVSFLAYSIGWRYPNLEKYILPVVLIVTVASVIAPIFLGLARKLLKSKNG